MRPGQQAYCRLSSSASDSFDMRYEGELLYICDFSACLSCVSVVTMPNSNIIFFCGRYSELLLGVIFIMAHLMAVGY